jgi:hypothetical protein
MKQPFMKSFPVHEWDYREKDVDVVIYSHYEVTPGDDREEDDSYTESTHYRDENERNAITKKDLSQINLQSLLDNLPEGVKPSDVKISMDIKCSDYAVEGTTLNFYYRKHLPARPELYQQEKAAYDKEWAEYEVKKSVYDKWVKDQEIKELQIRLDKLKK